MVRLSRVGTRRRAGLAAACGGVVAVVAVLACASSACSKFDADSEVDGGDARALADVAQAAVDAADGADGPDALTPEPNLVARYSFESTGGAEKIAFDTSGRGNDGILGADAVFIAEGASGRGVALQGNGRVLVESLAGTQFPASGTLSLWFRLAYGPADATTRGIFDNYVDGRAHIFVRRTPSVIGGDVQVAFQNAAGLYAFSTSFTPRDNAWTHVVLTWTDKTGACYVDGGLVSKEDYILPFSPVGQRFELGAAFVGGIDEVRLYDRALSATEAAALSF